MNASVYRELLIGCGNRRDLRVIPPGSRKPAWQNLITADIERSCGPALVIDLNSVPWTDLGGIEDSAVDLHGCIRPGTFDEVHAYEVLEHLGRQGDAHSFFATFKEIWRVLKPGGYLCATVPSQHSPWLWGDPGHTRVILPETLVFLSQAEYLRQVGVTPMTDYRVCYHADFDTVRAFDNGETFQFVLRAVKPTRHPDYRAP